MNTTAKIGLGIGALTALVLWGVSSAKNAIAEFTFEIIGYSKPTIKNLVLTVPLQIRFNNPTTIPLNIDRIVVDLYVLKNNTWVKGAQINQPLSITPGVSVREVYPALDIKAIFGGSVADTLLSVANAFKDKLVTVKADISITYKGVVLPKQYIPSQQLSF